MTDNQPAPYNMQLDEWLKGRDYVTTEQVLTQYLRMPVRGALAAVKHSMRQLGWVEVIVGRELGWARPGAPRPKSVSPAPSAADTWLEVLPKLLAGKTEALSGDILRWLGVGTSKANQMRLAEAMRALGWSNIVKWDRDYKRCRRTYQAPLGPPADPKAAEPGLI